MIVEFWGLPGTGKTTIAKEVARELGVAYSETHGGLDRYYYMFLYIIFHPLKFSRLLIRTIIESNKGLTPLRHKLFLLFTFVTRTSKALTHKGTSILDEGLGLFGISLYEHVVDEKIAKSYMKRFFYADYVVVLFADKSVRENRLNKRGRIPRRGTVKDYEKWRNIVFKNEEIFKSQFTDPRFIFVNTTEDKVNEYVNKIASEVQKRLS